VSASYSPSASVSASPSNFVTGIADEIIAIKQVDDLTIIESPTFNIVIHKPIDEITIKDVEDIISGSNTDVVFEVIVTKQADSLEIVKQPNIDLVIVD
jgi:hypothetical protein